MKRYCVLIHVVMSLLLLQAGCQKLAKEPKKPDPVALTAPVTESPEATEPGKPGPKITFESVEYDFGKVGPRQ